VRRRKKLGDFRFLATVYYSVVFCLRGRKEAEFWGKKGGANNR
jgi:hypothetical protein